MSTAARVAAFVAGLVAVFALAVGVGRAVGPVAPLEVPPPAAAGEDGQDPGHDDAGHDDAGHDDAGHDDAGHDDAATAGARGASAPSPGGLQVSEAGHTLRVEQAPERPGVEGELAFEVVGPDGQPVRDYVEQHERDLHLVVVRRDLTLFQHLHPRLDDDGTWRLPLTLPEAGVYRVIADFRPAGAEDGLVLGTDVTVPGPLVAQPLPEPSTVAEVDGYEVRLDGALVAGEESELTFTVSRDGQPVDALQPYLGANGHLVALRAGDVAYLHTHPTDGDPGARVSFGVTTPSPDDYRLFLDFRHGDDVRTAAFSMTAEPVAADGEDTGGESGEESGDEHAH